MKNNQLKSSKTPVLLSSLGGGGAAGGVVLGGARSFGLGSQGVAEPQGALWPADFDA